ncbi:MAG: nuclear transport factor 2 family protein [Chthoniobacterales bacterium]|nr:nuclear transport factor 2 family protein [Chthoniobacterales bacterium]
MSAQKGDGIPARFKEALQQTEEKRDAKFVANLFRQGAHLTNLGGDHGNDAAEFWKAYLNQFGEVHSEFVSEVVGESSAALEWRSRGTMADGRPVDYRGVSVLDFDAEGVTGFRTYYDSAMFVRTGA